MTHYEALGVAPSASPEEIRTAYLALARRHHPDRAGGDAALMRRANQAWAVLGDPARRSGYDRSIRSTEALPGGDERLPDRDEPGATISDLDDLLADLADDTPIGGTVALPRWLALVPVALFVAALGSGAVGAVAGIPALVALGAACFLLSCVLFLAAPFVALAASRRGARPHP